MSLRRMDWIFTAGECMDKILKTLLTLLFLPINLIVALGCSLYEVCEEFVYDAKGIWSKRDSEEEQ